MEVDEIGFKNKKLGHGYKELTIPKSTSGDYLMDPSVLHIWPRGNFMLIALPNTDKTFTCTLFAPINGVNSFGKIKTKEHILDFFVKGIPRHYCANTKSC